MEDNQLRKERARAVQRLIEGETPQAICASLKRSKLLGFRMREGPPTPLDPQSLSRHSYLCLN